jgi:hypothetical protein
MSCVTVVVRSLAFVSIHCFSAVPNSWKQLLLKIERPHQRKKRNDYTYSQMKSHALN